METPTLAIAMTTCDRTQFDATNYVEETWGSLVRSGITDQLGDGPLAFFSGGPGGSFAAGIRRLTDRHCFCAPSKFRLDVIRNSHRALAWLAGTGADYGLLLQDDILVCRNWLAEARRWLGGTAPKGGMLYSFATQYQLVEAPDNIARGWACYPADRFYGCWCIAMPREAILSYLLSDERQQAEERGKGFDMWLKWHVIARESRMYAHCPNIAIHVGMESAIGNDHGYAKGHHLFRGEHWDALAAACQR